LFFNTSSSQKTSECSQISSLPRNIHWPAVIALVTWLWAGTFYSPSNIVCRTDVMWLLKLIHKKMQLLSDFFSQDACPGNPAAICENTRWKNQVLRFSASYWQKPKSSTRHVSEYPDESISQPLNLKRGTPTL
jgi:hypothetical protein